ncbi:PAS domain-containing protein [Falsiroseomonas sp. E2-1-a4]|uniref:PAS domain-containing protein n=1 Tax=Falsiroseomonas sp. E2-1-a4 TaxID=3239299 RepID=UPI003F3F6685
MLADFSRFEATLHPDDRGIVNARKVAQPRGEPVVSEYRILRPDGEIRWILERRSLISTAPADSPSRSDRRGSASRW